MRRHRPGDPPPLPGWPPPHLSPHNRCLLLIICPPPLSELPTDALPPVRDEWDYTPLPKPIPITEQRWPAGTRPLVTVKCMTFNHERFIRQAIDGFLMQETTFPVQILVHDDASTDGTAVIVREYAERYPELIVAVLQNENCYSTGRWPNLARLQLGKYLAFCEGDDYWIANDKLQRQAEAMESDSRMVYCGTRAIVLQDGMCDGYQITPSITPLAAASAQWIATIDGRLWMKNCTRMYRLSVFEACRQRMGSTTDSYIAHYCAALCEDGNHRIGFLDRVAAVYREHAGGIFTGSSEKSRLLKWRDDLRVELPLFRSTDARRLLTRKLVIAEVRCMAYASAGLWSKVKQWCYLLKLTAGSPRLLKLALQCAVRR